MAEKEQRPEWQRGLDVKDYDSVISPRTKRYVFGGLIIGAGVFVATFTIPGAADRVMNSIPGMPQRISLDNLTPPPTPTLRRMP